MKKKPNTTKEANKEAFKAKLRASGSKKITSVSAAQPIKPVVKEEEPALYPDLFWVWEAFCYLSDRRQMGPNGPQPISVPEMVAFAELSGRTEQRYKEQLHKFIPPLDRIYLGDLYEKQAKEIEEQRKKAERAQRQARTRRI